MSTEISQAIQ